METERDRDPGIIISSVIDCVSDLVIQMSEDLDDRANEFAEKGASIMDFLELVNSKLGKFNAKTVDGKNVIATLKSFSTDAELLDTDENESKENSLIRFLDKRIQKLEQSLEGDWNQILPLEAEDSDWMFFKAENEKMSYVCEDDNCLATFTDGQSYQRHLKSKHNMKKTVKMPSVTCRLPHKSGKDEQKAKHQITAHIKTVHKIEKPSENHYFRGFVRSQGVYSPVFLLLEEPDPTNPFNGEVLENDATEVLSQGNHSIPAAESPLAEKKTPDKSEKMSPVKKEKEDSPFFRGYAPRGENDFVETFASPNSKESKESVDLDSAHGYSGDGADVLDSAPGYSGDRADVVCAGGDLELDEDMPQLIDADLQDFSDIEDGDSLDYTETRIKNRLYRYHLRESESKPEDLCNHEDNKEFIRECAQFILKKNLSRNEKKSNLDKSLGHLFRYDDSLLNYLAEKHPGFNLRRLIAFKDKDDFIQLKDPMLGWIKRTGGESGLENPGRQKEQLKAHENLRSFIIRKLKEEDFGNDLMAMIWGQKVREQIDQISEDIQHGEVFGQLNKLVEQNRQKVLIAKSILQPSDNQKEANALKVYFSSEKFRAREVKLNQVCQVAFDKNDVGHKDLYDVGNYGRTLLVVTDRLRRGSYKFFNNDYFGRQPRWIPAGANLEDFNGLPDELLSEEPEDKREPDMYVIQLSGEHQKCGSPATVTITRWVDQWLQKYRQLKAIAFGACLPDEPFFQHLNKKPFGNINYGKGSIMAEISSVTGVNFTTTAARRTLQPYIQSNEILKARAKTISQHSKDVASKHYDRTDTDFRAIAMNIIGKAEGTTQVSSNIDEDTEENVAKRRRLNEEDKRVAEEKAQEIIDNSKARNFKLGPTCKVLPNDRKHMQSLFTAGGEFENIVADGKKLKDAANFSRSFYRLLDSGECGGQHQERLDQIERSTFGVVKNDIVKKDGSWGGTLAEHKKADRMVGETILKSFKGYERSKKKDSPAFFT